MSGIRRYLWALGACAMIAICMVALFSVEWFAESELTLERRCRQSRIAQDWKGMNQVAEHWTRRYPKSTDAWLFRAEAAQEVHDYETVADALRKIPVDDDRVLPSRVELVTVLFEKLNRPQEAAEVCREILKLDPRVAVARQRLIFFYALTLQRAALIREIREAIHVRREPREAYVYLVGAQWLVYGNLYDLNSKWLESDPESEMFQVARAMQVLSSNAKDNLDRAAEFKHIPDADQLLEKFPRNIEVLAYHFEKKMAAGEIEEIQKLLSDLPVEVNADARIWHVRGWVKDAMGDIKGAEQDFKKSIEIDRYAWQTYHSLADLYRRTGQKELVQHHEKLYQMGKRLRDEIIKLQDARSTSPELLNRIANFAEACQDIEVAETLRSRLAE